MTTLGPDQNLFTIQELQRFKELVPPGRYSSNSVPLDCQYSEARGVISVYWEGVSMRLEAVIQPLQVEELEARLSAWDSDKPSFGDSRQGYLLPRCLTGVELKELADSLRYEVAISHFTNGQSVVVPGGSGNVGGRHLTLINSVASDQLISVGHLHPITGSTTTVRHLDETLTEVAGNVAPIWSMCPSPADFRLSRDNTYNYVFAPAGIMVYAAHPALLTTERRHDAGLSMRTGQVCESILFSVPYRICEDLAGRASQGEIKPEDLAEQMRRVFGRHGAGIQFVSWDMVHNVGLNQVLASASEALRIQFLAGRQAEIYGKISGFSKAHLSDETAENLPPLSKPDYKERIAEALDLSCAVYAARKQLQGLLERQLKHEACEALRRLQDSPLAQTRDWPNYQTDLLPLQNMLGNR